MRLFKFLGASVYERNEEKFSIAVSGKPVIYISLGTIVKGTASFFHECIKAFKDENVTVIMSVGKTFQIEKLGMIPDNFCVYDSVPQISVLKQADVFITHGGMNSVSEALVCGVPMLVVPFMTDQPTNARRIEEIGAVLNLSWITINQ